MKTIRPDRFKYFRKDWRVHERIKKSPCPACGFKSLLPLRYIVNAGIAKASYSLIDSSERELIQKYNGFNVKTKDLEQTPSEKLSKYVVCCTKCDWEDDMTVYGNIDPGCYNYSPAALEKDHRSIPFTICLGFTKKGKGCKSSVKKDEFLCSKHSTEEQKKRLKRWAKHRNIEIDLT